MSLHYNADNSYLCINGKEICKFKVGNKTVNFSTQFCIRCISNGFSATESREVSLNGNVSVFPVDYSPIEFTVNYSSKSGILNFHKYLMTQNNIK